MGSMWSQMGGGSGAGGRFFSSHLVLTKQGEVKQNLEGLRISRHHNELGDTSVERLCGLVGPLLELLEVGRLLDHVQNRHRQLRVRERECLGVPAHGERESERGSRERAGVWMDGWEGVCVGRSACASTAVRRRGGVRRVVGHGSSAGWVVFLVWKGEGLKAAWGGSTREQIQTKQSFEVQVTTGHNGKLAPAGLSPYPYISN